MDTEEIVLEYEEHNKVLRELKKAVLRAGGEVSAVSGAFGWFQSEAERRHISEEILRMCCVEVYNDVCLLQVGKGWLVLEQQPAVFLRSLYGKNIDQMFRYTRNEILKLYPQNEGQNHQMIGRIKQYIDQHLDEELSEKDLAEQLYVTPSHFSRLFKQEEGIGCREYIIARRLERAKNLLCSSDLRVGSIAAAVGYKDVNYFSASFKKYTGKAPGEYRQQGLEQ